ncbi:MAG: hypothetical protein K0U37_09810 [Gammaproteobacteria bacterium]|nr:hypothetical protein [Gammaproteobacteria bacterium]
MKSKLPVGVHSGAVGLYQGNFIFIAGRTNGLHGFQGEEPFPSEYQNTSIQVFNPETGFTASRSLSDKSSGLTQQQIDTLSVAAPQSYQDGTTLYMTGGYGINTATGTFDTKAFLTAINLPGILQWVTEPGNSSHSVIKNIRQLYNPVFQITGGKMYKLGHITQLIFGQNFTGIYTDGSNGVYSEQVRQFEIKEANGQLAVNIGSPRPAVPNANFRRRDLNAISVMLNKNNRLGFGFVVYSGVFTPDTGIWTVPVVIGETGDPVMADPSLAGTFKQGMNNYASATAGLYSRKSANMYNLFFGGISYGFYEDGVFKTDPEIPFINQITTIKMDKNGRFTQYLMDSEYPTILATRPPNVGNKLLFGVGAYFIGANIPQYSNKVISLDAIRKPTVIGYIAGGIQSTLPNTITRADSSASPNVFKVTLVPK